jgi:hypothetical protein
MKHIKQFNESITTKLIKDIIDDIEDTLIELVDKSIIIPQYKGIETLVNKISLKINYILNINNINNSNIDNMQSLLNALKTSNKRTNCQYEISRQKHEPYRKNLDIYVDLPKLKEIDYIWYYSECRMVLRYYLKDEHIIARIEMVNHERDEFRKHKQDIIQNCIDKFKQHNMQLQNIEVDRQVTMPYVIDFKITNI